jgi:hypothetical protein
VNFLLRHRLLLVLVIFMGAFPALIFACDVPVFRYALERWETDIYEINVYYRDSFPTEYMDSVNRLLEQTSESENGFNFTLILHDLNSSAEDHNPATNLPDEQLPYIAIHNPKVTPYPMSQGKLSEAFLNHLITSPARQEMIRRLLEGETAVWLFLASGNQESDSQALSVLQKEVAKLEQELTLPEPAEVIVGDDIKLDDAAKEELKIKFSILEISSDASQEQLLKDLLIHSEQDLVMYEDEPMVFPVFGRGRVLHALIGEGINAETLRESGEMLVAPCTCQLKELNPGFDLLMPVNWAASIEKFLVKDLLIPPPFAGLAKEALAATEASLAAFTLPEESVSSSIGNYWSTIFIAIAAFLVIDVIFAIKFLRRR